MAGDRQRLEAVIQRSIRSGLCPTNQLTVRELVDDADESLFTNILRYITETIYCTSFYLSDVTVHMICKTGLMTEN